MCTNWHIRLRAFALLFFGGLSISLESEEYHCPAGCSCIPIYGGQLKLICQWPVLHHPLTFSSLIVNRTSSLSIICTAEEEPSELAPGVFRLLGSLRHLSISGCHPMHNSLPKGLFAGLTTLRTLSLSMTNQGDRELSVLQGTFMDLKRLEKLLVTGYKLKVIPSEELCSLLELKWLNLSSNSISSIDSVGLGTTCQQPSQLVMLDLSFNYIRAVPVDCFGQLKHLHLLHLAYNHISSIAPNGFTQLYNLRRLELQGNRLSSLPEPIVIANPKLESLDLSFNIFPHIPQLQNLTSSLIRLNMSHNIIASLHGARLRLHSLRVLDLSFNRIRMLPANIFDNLTMLTSADFSQNYISKIERFAFRDLRSLEILIFANNKLNQLNHESFYHLESLKQLTLSNNSITDLSSQFFSGMTRISSLDISHNQLQTVPKSIVALYYLTNLSLAHNRIDDISRSILDHLPNLRNLDLSRNKMHRINRYIFENLVKLQYLDLSNNRVSTIDGYSFYKTDRLERLDLQHNALLELSSALIRLPSLKWVNISWNNITSFDLSLLPDKITALYISHNKLERLTDSEEVGNSLHEIDASYNKLSSVDFNLLNAKALGRANFSHNQIVALNVGLFYTMPDLESLDLTYNNFKEINMSTVSLAPDRTENVKLYLQGNPFTCSCTISWLKKQQRFSGSSPRNVPAVTDLEHITCSAASGPHSSATPLSDVPIEEFLCRYGAVCLKEDCLCCDYESCDCKSVCPPGCICYRDPKFSRNIVLCTNNTRFSQTHDQQLTIASIPMFATEIHLDGISLGSLNRHDFLARFRLRNLYLNNSNISAIASKAFTGLRSLLTLDLSQNEIRRLTGLEFHGLPVLNRLDLSNNVLEELQEQTFASMPKLQHLFLHGNRLRTLPDAIVAVTPTLSTLTISHNPWLCDCDDRFIIQQWLPDNSAKVMDSAAVYCYENFTNDSNRSTNDTMSVLALLSPSSKNLTVTVNFWTFVNEIVPYFCLHIDSPDDINSTTIDNITLIIEEQAYGLFVIGGACTLVSIILIGLIVWRMRMVIKHRLAAANQKTFLASMPTLDPSPAGSSSSPFLQYDAFVCYSIEDKDMVRNDITSKLEEESPHYELCLLYRDILTGPYTNRHVISDEIITSMDKSQRILLLLTANFLGLEWRLVQIRTALQCVLKDPRRRSLIVILADCAPLSEIDTILGHYIRTNVCISQSDPLFLEKLRQAMPARMSTSSLNRTSSSELYGTIIPSDFV